MTNSTLGVAVIGTEVDCARWLLDQEITTVTVVRPSPSTDAPSGLSDPQFVIFETDGYAAAAVCEAARKAQATGEHAAVTMVKCPDFYYWACVPHALPALSAAQAVE